MICPSAFPKYQKSEGQSRGASELAFCMGNGESSKIMEESLLYWYTVLSMILPEAARSARWLPHISLVHSVSSGSVFSGCPLIH